MDLINLVEQSFSENKTASYPKFKAGDTVTVTYRIKEGEKYRLQSFRGVVIQICGSTPYTKTFTVRKVSNGIGVERISRTNLPRSTALNSTKSVKSVAPASSTSATSPVRRPASRKRSAW